MPGLLWYLLPLASGVLASLSLPPRHPSPTLWVALVPLLLFLEREGRPGRAFLGGWLAGGTYYGVIAYPFTSLIWWGWAQTPQEYAAALRQQQVFLALWHPITAAWAGAWWGVFAASLVALTRSPRARRTRVWLAPALWIVLCEHLTAASFFDYTWGWLGYATHHYTTLRQLAAWTGVAGLSALVVLVNAWISHALALAGSALRRRRLAPGWAAREALLATGVIAVGLTAWGVAAAHERHAGRHPADAPRLSVAALQAGRRPYEKQEFARGALDWSYTPLLDRALAGGARLLLLPESVWLAKLMLDSVPIADTLSRHVGPAEVQAFLGPRLEPAGAVALVGFDVAERGRLFNSIVVWNGDGILGQYRKRRLTPFAEYAPGPRQWLAPRGRLTYTPGHGSQLLRAGGVRLGAFICQEAQFPALTRESARDGAQILVTNGNDGIFRDPRVALAHHVAAQFRAIETHRPLVRAMKTGVSSVVDAHGHALQLSAMERPAILLAEVSASDYETFYTHWGEWLVALAAGWAVGLAAWRLLQRRAAAP